MARISTSVEACGEKTGIVLCGSGALRRYALLFNGKHGADVYAGSNVGVIISIAPFFTAIFSFFLRKGISREKGFSWAL